MPHRHLVGRRFALTTLFAAFTLPLMLSGCGPRPGDADYVVVGDDVLPPVVGNPGIADYVFRGRNSGDGSANQCAPDATLPAALSMPTLDSEAGVFLRSGGRVSVEMRIDERGCVTSARVVEAVPAAAADLVLARCRQMWFHPARRGAQPVPTRITSVFTITGEWPDHYPSYAHRTVPELERVLQKAIAGEPTDISPQAAYLRLGHLGTAASLAAIRRVEAASARSASFAALNAPQGGYQPFLRARSANGMTYGVVRGSPFWWLLTVRRGATATRWSRPALIPLEWQPGCNAVALSSPAPGSVRVTLQHGEHLAGATRSARRDTYEFSVADIERDSDADGWTDMEEKRLGLDPNNADSDGDGIADAEDECPDYAPSASDRDDSASILQRALHAVVGLSGSRHILIADARSQRVQLRGGRVLVLYGIGPADVSRTARRYSHEIAWKIFRTSAQTARVRVETRFEGYDVFLERMEGEWFPVFEDLLFNREPALFDGVCGTRDRAPSPSR